MLFNSFEFIAFFLPITLIVFFFVANYISHKYAIFWLVLMSLVFYGWWNASYLYLLLSSILTNYVVGLKITKYNYINNYNKSLIFLVIGIVFNLLLLIYYKYSNFFISSFNYSVGLDWNLHYVILPIGISFFTFQQIAYLVDTRINKTSEHNFIQYSLFVVFFPQLIAGPIVHHSQMLPQFSKSQTFKPMFSNFSVGFSIFIIGLFKKVIIADNLALYADPIFDFAEAGNSINFFQAWIASFAYSLQLYFDFSGYSDMAIGLARMFGIKLPINFYSPYKATSIIEFWQRWHMTLSEFLRDYVYIPLGGNRNGAMRRYINLMLTMLIGGLWHGAAWTFVVWGALHGTYIIVNHLWRIIWRRQSKSYINIFFNRVFTLIFISLAWVLFRSDTFSGAMQIYKGLFNLPTSFLDVFGEWLTILNYLGFSFSNYNVSFDYGVKCLILLIAVIAVWVLPNTSELMSRYSPAIDFERKFRLLKSTNFQLNISWKPNIMWSIFISFLIITVFLNLTQVSEFLYFQF